MRQPKWSQYEVVLLVEAYWKIKKDKSSRKSVIAQLSAKLRAFAKAQGLEIDDTFRNENGISMRLGELEYLFSGDGSGLKNTSDLFREIVDLYRSDYNQFEKLLMEAKAMMADNKTIEADFMQYLTAQMSPAKISGIYWCYSEIEAFCQKINVLNKPLFHTTDFEVIAKVQRTIEQNKIFRVTHRKHYNRIVSAGRYYYNYIREGRFPVISDSVDSLITNESTTEIENTSVISFADWLRDIEKMADATCRSYSSAINKAEKFAQANHLAFSRMIGADKDEALGTVTCLMEDAEFRRLNSDQHNRFSAAFQKLQKYYQYLDPTGVVVQPALPSKPARKVASVARVTVSEDVLVEELSAFLKSHTDGLSKDAILAHFSKYSTQQINRALVACHAVKVLKQYYHKDCISDYTEMADILLDVLLKQFAAKGDYTSAQLLYNEAHFRLDDFFFYNNAFESRMEVYDLAAHLFSQEQYKGYTFLFVNGMHIWKSEPDYPKDFHGLMIKYGREHHNVFTREEAVAFYDSIGSATPVQSFSNVLFTTGSKSFLQYDENCFVLCEALHVNDNFLHALKAQIENLLEGEVYIAFGEIDDYFYTTLPALPTNISWSPLLLEDMLRVFDIGYTTVEAGEDNDKKTIPAAILKTNSQFRTFSDLVWNEISKAYPLPKELTAMEFREFLLDRGFIHGSEKMWNVHKTVAGDLRFYWTEENGKVTIH